MFVVKHGRPTAVSSGMSTDYMSEPTTSLHELQDSQGGEEFDR